MPKAAFPPRLLVAHPDSEVRTFLRRRFGSLGYQVKEAGDHATALELTAGLAFDLALVDLRTAGADGEGGLELLRRLREASRELPILAVAAESANDEAVEALALGADDCLLRPLYFDVARARTEMILGARAAKTPSGRGDLMARLDTLEASASRSQAVGAALEALGHDPSAHINSLLGATSVLTRVCSTPELTPAIDRIETAAAALDLVMVRGLGRADRRSREPKSKLDILLVDDDATSRHAVQQLLEAAAVEVNLVTVANGQDAVFALDTNFFDLIVMNLAAPDTIPGIRAIRHVERRNTIRRTPVLVIGEAAKDVVPTLEAGADLFLRRPFSAERLLATLAEALVRESEDVTAVA
ncbi:response regulator [Phenylobacterium sp.]|jgi:DNA-binding response OmpR family regulator|uniref:response regulator n=1 Tax=Phenylobacterium sp. TaxID=1871053 RepID=UPI002F9335C9